jgi:hypothetical protein
MTHPDSTSRTPRALALAPLYAVAVFALLIPRVATAQGEAPDCIAIIADMLTATPSAGTIRASAGCPSSGPVTLANRWTRVGPRSATERSALVDASSLLRDSRIYEAVLGISRDASRPAPDRLAAIRVMLDYADNGYMVSQQGEAHDANASASAARAQSSTAINGSVALTPGVRSDVKRELYRLASVDRDPDVRRAAQRGSESLGYVLPSKAKVGHYRAP